MRREFYINNQLCDIEPVSVPLNFACSEVADLNGISGNYSLTVKLPLTNNNITIAKNCQNPNTSPASLWSGYKAKADYFVDGVPIFQNADVRLLSSETAIEVNVSFGNLIWLDVLENIKLKDCGFTKVLDWNYWDIANEDTEVRWLLTNWGGTFDGLQLHMERLHPHVNIKFLWDLIWNKLLTDGVISSLDGVYTIDDDLWLPVMSQVMNPLLEVSMTGTSYQDYHMAGTGYDPSKNMLNNFTVTSTVVGLRFDSTMWQAPYDPETFFIIPKDGNYLLTGQFDTSGTFTDLNLYAEYKDEAGLLQLVFLATIPTGTPFSFTVNLKKQAYHLVPILTGISGDCYLLSGSTFKIQYKVSDKKENIEFLMPYDIALNLPDWSCKDFVKAVMQFYGLMCENNANPLGNNPLLFNFNLFDTQVTNGNTQDWSDKLVSFDKPKIEWNLGFKEKNYLRFTQDEVDGVYADAYFTTYENDKTEKDVFVSKFSASFDEEQNSGTTYFPVPVCSIAQWTVEVNDFETIYKWEGKAKQRIVRGYKYDDSGGTYTIEIAQLFGEGYTPVYATDANSFVSWFKTLPNISEAGKSLDMATIMGQYYYGFIESVKSNRLFTWAFLLTEMDISRFTHTIPVYVHTFANWYFVKKILNWEAGKVCNVELLPLMDSGIVAVEPEQEYITFIQYLDLGETGFSGDGYLDYQINIGGTLYTITVAYGIGTTMADICTQLQADGTYIALEEAGEWTLEQTGVNMYSFVKSPNAWVTTEHLEYYLNGTAYIKRLV